MSEDDEKTYFPKTRSVTIKDVSYLPITPIYLGTELVDITTLFEQRPDNSNPATTTKKRNENEDYERARSTHKKYERRPTLRKPAHKKETLTPSPYLGLTIPKTPDESLSALFLEEYGRLNTKEQQGIGRLTAVYRTILSSLVKQGCVTIDSRGKVEHVIEEKALTLAIAKAMIDCIFPNRKKRKLSLQSISPIPNYEGATLEITSKNSDDENVEPATSAVPIPTLIESPSPDISASTQVNSRVPSPPAPEKNLEAIEPKLANYVPITPIAFNKLVRAAYCDSTYEVRESFKNSRDARKTVLEILMKDNAVVRLRTGQVTQVVPDIEERVRAILPNKTPVLSEEEAQQLRDDRKRTEIIPARFKKGIPLEMAIKIIEKREGIRNLLTDRQEEIMTTAVLNESVKKTLVISGEKFYIADPHACYHLLKSIIIQFGYQYLHEQGVRYSDELQEEKVLEEGRENDTEDEDPRINFLRKMLTNRRRA